MFKANDEDDNDDDGIRHSHELALSYISYIGMCRHKGHGF